MVQSRAATVDGYLAEQSEERREVLGKVRALAGRALPGFTEAMRYGMMGFVGPGERSVTVGSQVQYVAFYLGPAVLEAHREDLRGLDRGKGCLRFSNPARIDWGLIERLFRTAAVTDPAPEPPRRRAAGRSAGPRPARHRSA